RAKTLTCFWLPRKRFSTDRSQVARFITPSSGIQVALSSIQASQSMAQGVLNRMKRWYRLLVSFVALLAAAPAFAQVNMATAGPAGTAFTFAGTRAGALAGTTLVRVD